MRLKFNEENRAMCPDCHTELTIRRIKDENGITLGFQYDCLNCNSKYRITQINPEEEKQDDKTQN